jgi:hypothetical protein
MRLARENGDTVLFRRPNPRTCQRRTGEQGKPIVSAAQRPRPPSERPGHDLEVRGKVEADDRALRMDENLPADERCERSAREHSRREQADASRTETSDTPET